MCAQRARQPNTWEVSPNTVGRAYADLCREGVIVGHSAIAGTRATGPARAASARHERLGLLACQTLSARWLLALTDLKSSPRSHVSSPATVLCCSLIQRHLACTKRRRLARNHPCGRVSCIPAGELLAEVSLEVPSVTVVAAMTRMSLDKLGLEPGRKASAYVKATQITLGP